MTIEEFVLTEKEAKALQKLKDNFEVRFQNSPEKRKLLAREIEGYSLIFDEEKLPIQEFLHDDSPLEGYSTPEYCSMQIYLIRIFWIRFIVDGHSITEIENNEWDDWFFKLNDFAPDYLTEKRHYYSIALVYRKYLDWLTKYKIIGIKNAELALIKVYEGEILKKDNTKLYQNWAFYRKKVNRLGVENTNLKNRNKIDLFERVIEKLSEEAKIKAEKDLLALKINIEDQGFKI